MTDAEIKNQLELFAAELEMAAANRKNIKK